MPKKKKQNKESISGLLDKIDRIEKKLNLLSIMGKSMPVIILANVAILGSVTYLSSVAKIPDVSTDSFELPQTGSSEYETTEDFVILFPEEGSTISLPGKVVGLSINGFYSSNTTVTFFAQNDTGDVLILGAGEKSTDPGEYKTTWKSAPSGVYSIWATVENLSGKTVKSHPVSITIE